MYKGKLCLAAIAIKSMSSDYVDFDLNLSTCFPFQGSHAVLSDEDSQGDPKIEGRLK